MTSAEAVRGLAGPVGKLGGAWMFDGVVSARGEQLGLGLWSWYYCGRGGVLGNVDADVVSAAFVFFPPELVRKGWERGRAVMPVAEAAGHYAQACAEFGRRSFGAVDGSERLADLLRTALGAADPAGMPLFAAWRAVPEPEDGPGRLALALQVAREHRGSAHAVAVVASGLHPLQAVVSGRYGVGNATFFGWPEPYPDPAVGADAMAEAEALTDRLVEPAFASLPDDDRAELVAGLRALRV